VFPDVIAYANSDEDAAETEDDYSCEMKDGLERGATGCASPGACWV